MLHPLSLLFPSAAVKGTFLRAFLALGPVSNTDATGKVQCPACARTRSDVLPGAGCGSAS
jgi:hypothetical protein